MTTAYWGTETVEVWSCQNWSVDLWPILLVSWALIATAWLAINLLERHRPRGTL